MRLQKRYNIFIGYTSFEVFFVFLEFFLNRIFLVDCWLMPMFENYSKCRIIIFQFWHCPPIFGDLSSNTAFNRFEKVAKMDKFLSFLINFGPLKIVECDFSCDFQTLCDG